MTIETSFQLLAILVTLAVFLPLVRCPHWLVRGWDFPRIQLLFAAVAVLAALAFVSFDGTDTTLDRIVAGVLGIAIIALGRWMRPYTPFHRKEVRDGNGGTGVSFLVSNVLMTNRDSDRLLALVKDLRPDVFLALETDRWWTGKIAALAEDYPHAIELPQDDTYGMVLRSRLPLIDPSVERIVNDNIPSIHVDLELEDGARIKLHAVHPKPPFPDEDTSSTDRDAELLVIGERIRETDCPTVVFGDLNDVAWSRTTRLFQKISGLLDPRVGRGFFCTFHADHWFLRWPLDHIFISRQFRVRSLKRLVPIGSDHFPIFVELSFQPDAENKADPPEEDAGDREEAEEKIDDAEEKNGHRIS